MSNEAADRTPLNGALIGALASLMAAVAWKVFDTPIQRQIARQIPEYVTAEVSATMGWLVPLLLILPAVFFVLRLARGR